MENLTPTGSKLENFVKSILGDKIKNVRESILLGEIALPNKLNDQNTGGLSYLNLNENTTEDLATNSMIINYMLKENNLNLMNEKRKAIENKINMIDLTILKMKKQIHDENIEDSSPKLFSSKLIISPLKSRKAPRTLKLTEDVERKQLESNAKNFIQKLNKEKGKRLIQEEEKRKKIEAWLLDPSIGKDQRATPQVKGSSMIAFDPSKVNIKNTLDNVKMVIKESHHQSKIKRIPPQLSQALPVLSYRVEQSCELLSKSNLHKSDDYSNQDNSTSFKSIKKSPYYFNDPKLSKILNERELSSGKNAKARLKPNKSYGIAYISDENNASIDDIELL